ncbi:MAG: tetratricopeptide repeat protein [Nitrospira sp. CG24B]|nr:MAG: tetratricopeptide repeat protein [Nitrospira sp. CG24B]
MRVNKKPPLKSDKTQTSRAHKRGVVGYSRKTALLEEAITQMNAGKYGRSSTALKELLALDPQNMEARRLFATLHLRLGSLIPARQAFDSLISEALERQDYWLAESLLHEYLAAGPRCVPFLEKLGGLYQEKGDTHEAVAEFAKAIDILIEDPDPDNPHHASQLYDKIRELAPSSPVAFRLASFFDAQTGELLARPSGNSGPSTDAPSLDRPETSQGVTAGSEPMDGVMPWEIQDSLVTLSDSPNAATVSDSPGSLTPPTVADLSTSQAHQHDEALLPSDPPLQEQTQTMSSTSEVGSAVSDELRTDEGGPVPSGSQIDDLPGEGELGDSYSLVPSSVSEDGPTAAQEQDRGLVEAEPEASFEASVPLTGVAPQDSITAPEALMSSIQPAEDISDMSSCQVEERSVLAVESPETPLAPDSMVSPGGPIESQEQDGWVAEAEPHAPYDAGDPITVVVPTELTTAPEVPASAIQFSEDTSVMPASQVEEISAPAFSGAEQSSVQSIEAEESQPSLLQPVETEPKEVVTEQPPGIPNPSSPVSVSGNEVSEPWKQPGFSWESVFNSAWKLGSDRSAHGSPSELTETNVGEAPTPASAVGSHQEQVLEDRAVEIPERKESTLFGDRTSAGSPIAPMPWDHVQESVISIPLAQVDPPMTESLELAVDPLPHPPEPELPPTVSESQVQPPSSPDTSVEEMDSFSIVPTPLIPVSPDLEIAAELEDTTLETEQASAPAESEPQFRMMSTSTIDELPPEAPAAALEAPVFAGEPVAGAVPSPSDVPSKDDDDFLLNTEEEHAIATDQSLVQESTPESPVALPQASSETPSQEADEIPPPSPLRTQQRILESQPEMGETSQRARETAEVQVDEPQPKAMAFVEAQAPIPAPVPEPMPEQEEWIKAGESIRFIEQPQATLSAQVSPESAERQDVGRSMSVAAAVDVLFESSQHVRVTETREDVAAPKPRRKSSSTLIRARAAIAGFISSCFSTTRALVVTCVGLVMLSGLLIALGIGAIGLTWLSMEESPSPTFQSLTTTPQRTLSDFKKNGYLFLLGFDVSVGHDPIQTGYDRKPETHDGKLALACLGSSGSGTVEGVNASANVMRGWIRSSDPVGAFKSHQQTIKEWGNQHESALNRYSQWQKLPFEDWGYGQTVSPPCTAMVFAHQLHVADGFLQGTDLGIDRLETDMEAWRIVLSQAKTLAVKMLALQAINDDIAVASGLLVGSNFDGKYLGRVTKVLRPLDQGELSMRWPMQSELVVAAKTYETQLKTARAEELPVYTMVASALPLPMQRRLNAYAEYYDASYKAVGEERYGSLPKWKEHIRFPASGVMDYLTNPIENIVGLEPLAPWDLYNGFVVDTDAHLRLASVQAWLRRGSADGDLATRIAKAGQSLYDPYTGLPMLMNMKKGVLYSVGHDGKDQDADPQSDVVVEIPVGHTSVAPVKSSASSSKPR